MAVRLLVMLLLLVVVGANAREYKTGYVADYVLSLSAYWDGTKWKADLVRLQVMRSPNNSITSTQNKVLFSIDGYTVLPSVPNQTKANLKLNSTYANRLNNTLPRLARDLLTKYSQSGRDKVVFDLKMRTSDGKEVSYSASYDGDNGYRSYGFQDSSPNIGFFTYYTKKVDLDNLPPPPQPLVGSTYANNMGKYDEVIMDPKGKIIYQVFGVDVNGKYDPPDTGDQDSGFRLFIREVVNPEMRKYDANTSIVYYYYKIRPTTDDNGEYAYYVDIPYREINVCQDGVGTWNDTRKRCETTKMGMTTVGSGSGSGSGKVIGESCVLIHGYKYYHCLRLLDTGEIQYGHEYWQYDSRGGNWIRVWNNVKTYTINDLPADVCNKSASGVKLIESWYRRFTALQVLIGGFRMYAYCGYKNMEYYGDLITVCGCPAGYTEDDTNKVCYKNPPNTAPIKETIRYNYQTVADLKIAVVNQDGSYSTTGMGQVQGSQYNYSYEKASTINIPQWLNILNRAIISIKDNDYSIVDYTTQPVKSVAPITFTIK